jgi:DNA-binding MarR family transcriptional regulator
MKLTSTEQRLLALLQVPRTREELARLTGGHPVYIARVLKSMTDRGLLETSHRPAIASRLEWRAKVRLELVPNDTASDSLSDVQGVG